MFPVYNKSAIAASLLAAAAAPVAPPLDLTDAPAGAAPFVHGISCTFAVDRPLYSLLCLAFIDS